MGTGAVTTFGFEILDLWHSEINWCYKFIFLNIREWQIAGLLIFTIDS